MQWPRPTGRHSPKRSSSSTSSPTSPNSPASARRTPKPSASGCTARANTSTPTCRASTWMSPACRRASRPDCPYALGHYGITDLERTPTSRARSSASSWHCSGRRRRPRSSLPCCGGGCASDPAPELRDPVGSALERLVSATQIRIPAIADLARGRPARLVRAAEAAA